MEIYRNEASTDRQCLVLLYRAFADLVSIGFSNWAQKASGYSELFLSFNERVV